MRVSKNEIESNVSIFNAIDFDEVLKPTKKDNSLLLEIVSDDEDGTFPTIKKYTNLMKRLNEDGASAFLDWWIGKKKKFDFGSFILERLSKYGNDVKVTFKEPIKIIIGEVGEDFVIEKITEIIGETNLDYYWSNNGRQNEYANGIEFSLEIKSIK